MQLYPCFRGPRFNGSSLNAERRISEVEIQDGGLMVGFATYGLIKREHDRAGRLMTSRKRQLANDKLLTTRAKGQYDTLITQTSNGK